MSVTKQELKYILYSSLFSIAWFVFLMPYLLNKGVQDSNPYFQFLAFNVGIFLLLSLFMKAMAMKLSTNIKLSLGLVALFLVMDIFAPPFSVDKTGQLLGEGGNVILIKSSTDYIAGYFAINTIHLSGLMVFLFTYLITPALLLFFAARLLPNFVKHV